MIVGSWTASRPTFWRLRATAMSSGSKATSKPTKPTSAVDWAPTRRSRTGSSTGRWRGDAAQGASRRLMCVPSAPGVRKLCYRHGVGKLDIHDGLTKKQVMNKVVTLAEAKAHISALVTEAEAGAEITITRHGKPVARIVGAPTRVKRVAGDWGWT